MYAAKKKGFFPKKNSRVFITLFFINYWHSRLFRNHQPNMAALTTYNINIDYEEESSKHESLRVFVILPSLTPNSFSVDACKAFLQSYMEKSFDGSDMELDLNKPKYMQILVCFFSHRSKSWTFILILFTTLYSTLSTLSAAKDRGQRRN